MTLVASKCPRRVAEPPGAVVEDWETEPGTKLRVRCYWQAAPLTQPTLVLVHGLEGSMESTYMRGTAAKAWRAGFNAVQANQRNCGGSEHLTETLYNSGLSCDYRAILEKLIRDGKSEVFFCGYSMGGNLVLKMAGELGAAAPEQLRGVVAVSPSLELGACADMLHLPRNAFYEWHFVRNLKKRFRRKVELYPQRYQFNGLDRVRSVREFDDVITAPYCGYRDAVDYYTRASALRVAANIRVPTLIITAEDDPFIPLEPFRDPAITQNRHIALVVTQHGGHCGFVSRYEGDERFWAEARTVEFCLANRRSGSREVKRSG